MFNRQHRIWASYLCLLAFGTADVARADGWGTPYADPRYNLGVKPSVQQTSVQQDDEELIVLQEDIKSKKEEIIVLQQDIKEIDRELRKDDPFEHGCDCRASLKICDASVFASLNLDPESPTSCEDIYEKQPKLNRLPRDCRRLVRTCRRVDRREARRENRQRIRELEAEIRECQRKVTARKSEIRKQRKTASTDCEVCNAYAFQPRMSNGAAIALGLAPYMTMIGMGLINKSMYNKGINAYYNAYNNSANQFYGQAGDYYNTMLQMGIPPSPLGYPAPYPLMGNAGMGLGLGMMGMNPMMGMMNGMSGMNPYLMGMTGMNGYNPFGITAGIGLNANLGLNPYGIGMQAAAWPYSMGMNGMGMMNPFSMGLNNGMYMNPYANMGWNGGGWNTGYNPYGNYQYQMMMQQQYAAQYMQQAYADQAAAQYRYQQVLNNAYSLGGYGGGYGMGMQNPYGMGLGINIGIGGSIGLGVGGYPSYGGFPSMGGYNVPGYGGSTF